ncbi:MAG: hypothetical protein ACRDWT_17645 [Jatrophihabitantaceae bacterium]
MPIRAGRRRVLRWSPQPARQPFGAGPTRDGGRESGWSGALNLLAGAALCHRERYDTAASSWALISCMSNGHLLAPPLIT